MYISEVVATNNEDQRRSAYLCNFIFHDGIPILQKGFCTHPLVNPDSYRVANSFFPVCHHLWSTAPFYEWNVQFFSFGTLKWEFEAGKDECNVFSCSGIGSFVNNPETHGKWKREVNKSVEAKDAISTFLSVRSHYYNETTVWFSRTLNLPQDMYLSHLPSSLLLICLFTFQPFRIVLDRP